MEKERKDRSEFLFGVISVLVLVIVCLVLFVFYQNNKLLESSNKAEVIEENNVVSSISVEEEKESDEIKDDEQKDDKENESSANENEEEVKHEEPVVKPNYGFTVEKAPEGSTYIAKLYLNPTDATKKCDLDTLKQDGMMYPDAKDRGCLLFYVYSKSQDGKSYDAIMSENIVNHTMWTTTNNVYDGPVQALKALQMYTESWTAVNRQTGRYGMHVKVEDKYLIDYDILYEPYVYYSRLITGAEIAQIVGKPEQLNEVHKTGKYIKFDDSIEDGTLAGVNQNKYGWLFSSTSKCDVYGCYNVDYNSNGYWTATASPYIAPQMAGAFPLAVDYSGVLTAKVGPGSDYYGVRPVISIPTSWIE